MAYYATLNRILDSPEAEAFDAQLVRRLRRVRSRRRQARSSRTRGFAV